MIWVFLSPTEKSGTVMDAIAYGVVCPSSKPMISLEHTIRFWRNLDHHTVVPEDARAHSIHDTDLNNRLLLYDENTERIFPFLLIVLPSGFFSFFLLDRYFLWASTFGQDFLPRYETNQPAKSFNQVHIPFTILFLSRRMGQAHSVILAART